jgi:DNA replication protein DnaC
MAVEPIGEQLGRIRRKAEDREHVAHAEAKRVVDPLGIQADLAERDAQLRQAAARHAQWQAMVPPKYHEAYPENFDNEAHMAIVTWQANASTGATLIVTGPTGSGKTRAAFAAVRAPFKAGHRFEFWPEGELKDALDWKADNHRDVMANVAAVPVLILDDLGVDAPNDWWVSKLYNLVNRRWLSDLPTIVTTNLEPKALREAIGERTLSRLGERAVTIRLTGGDRRRPPR